MAEPGFKFKSTEPWSSCKRPGWASSHRQKNLCIPCSFSGQTSSSSSQEHTKWLQEILRESGLRSPGKTGLYLQLISTLPYPADSSDKWSRGEATTGFWGEDKTWPPNGHWSDPCPDWLHYHGEPFPWRNAGSQDLESTDSCPLLFPFSFIPESQNLPCHLI